MIKKMLDVKIIRKNEFPCDMSIAGQNQNTVWLGRIGVVN